MEPDELLDELQHLAERLQVQVRYESTGGRVGRCVLRGPERPVGDTLVVIDRYLPLRDKIEGLAQMLADLDYEELYMPELVRDLLHARRDRYRQLPLPFPTP
ncbi:MAG: hypothetical protein KKI08_21960 [Armatimonadetes bacterium]|nr:hypothetical protein [Armatimonadota bacterium]